MPRNPFKKDDRVSIRPGIKKQGARHGVVARDPKKPNLVAVIWDGNTTPAIYHIDLLRRASPTQS